MSRVRELLGWSAPQDKLYVETPDRLLSFRGEFDYHFGRPRFLVSDADSEFEEYEGVVFELSRVYRHREDPDVEGVVVRTLADGLRGIAEPSASPLSYEYGDGYCKLYLPENVTRESYQEVVESLEELKSRLDGLDVDIESVADSLDSDAGNPFELLEDITESVEAGDDE